mgnify:CR=1 FL=1
MIEKMKFLSFTGPKKDIDRFVLKYLSKYEIHLENALAQLGQDQKNVTPYIEANPYREALNKAKEFEGLLGSTDGIEKKEISLSDAMDLVKELDQRLVSLKVSEDQLTEKIRRKPYSVVLFDEIEKAHPDVFNTLLQLLDDGRLTDSQGRTVDFRNCIVIMTSNIGSPHLLDGIGEDGSLKEGARDAVMEELRRHFRPEFLNRVDETVLFLPLRRDQVTRIVDLQMDRLRKRLEERKITLGITDAAREFIAGEAYDPVYGARPLKRYVQQYVETPLARELVSGRILDGQAVQIDVRDGELVFQNA